MNINKELLVSILHNIFKALLAYMYIIAIYKGE